MRFTGLFCSALHSGRKQRFCRACSVRVLTSCARRTQWKRNIMQQKHRSNTNKRKKKNNGGFFFLVSSSRRLLNKWWANPQITFKKKSYELVHTVQTVCILHDEMGADVGQGSKGGVWGCGGGGSDNGADPIRGAPVRMGQGRGCPPPPPDLG